MSPQEPADANESHSDGSRYVAATISYDGTDFAGFQVQGQAKPGAATRTRAQPRTVQGVLEAALDEIHASATGRVVAAGRTDAGVHALGQVIAFRSAWRHSLADLQRALNAVLPADVVVVALRGASEGWHPRFSAVRRTYRYTVVNALLRSPLQRRYAHLVTGPLDVAALQAAADLIVGEHDFAAFGRPMQPGETTIRRIYEARWFVGADLAPVRTFVFDVTGNAFLRGMVRALVGSLLRVGTGAWPPERLAEVLAGRDRACAAPPAPACGLCLMHVNYDAEP